MDEQVRMDVSENKRERVVVGSEAIGLWEWFGSKEYGA